LLSDAGPYTALSPRVIDQACLFSGGPYRVPAVRVEGWAVHTNNANGSAFRGFGINQAAVAIESLMDEAAQRLGLDPFAIRLRNALKPGDHTVSGEVLRHSVAIRATLEAAQAAWEEERGHWQAQRAQGRCIGVGVASGFKNVGAGKGKVDDAGAIFSLEPDGRVLLRASAVDMGQGIRTALVQIASEVLDLPGDRFIIVTGDTARTIRHGGAVGERQTLIAGRAVEEAARLFRRGLVETAAAAWAARHPGASAPDPDAGAFARGRLSFPAGDGSLGLDDLAEYLASIGGQLEVSYTYVAPKTYALADKEARRTVPPEDYRNYPAYAYTTQVAIVEVDVTNGAVAVLKVIAAHDCGRAINPQKIEGQIEGSCLMGQGYALSEAYVLSEGRPQTRTFRQLGVPTFLDAPTVRCLLIEDPEPDGPFGAKGVSEVATVPVTPAILNAIHDAVGVRIRTLPATPGRVLEALAAPAGR
jgi:CO/xanthine dehydrogenase Mo-binding subunit